jgi:hypothetical protein
VQTTLDSQALFSLLLPSRPFALFAPSRSHVI